LNGPLCKGKDGLPFGLTTVVKSLSRGKNQKTKVKVVFLTSNGSQFPNILPHILTTFVQIY